MDTMESAVTTEVPEHLVAQADIPLTPAGEYGCALICQGDVMVVTARPGKVDGLIPVPPEGIAVVKGEAGGNTHLLTASGPASWAWAAADSGAKSLLLGTLDLPDGSSAYLGHIEHGDDGIAGPGQFRISRQRQQADEIELVRD